MANQKARRRKKKKKKKKKKVPTTSQLQKIAKDQPRSRRILIQNKSEDAWTICHKQKRYEIYPSSSADEVSTVCRYFHYL
ncbi:hypothetical protein ASPVEDRAFT_469802 [Aspergillus versicolor CBS 583.65]|uniref:Uncharacterized protein n=1 Tax=Aspergillus versicolor CBS 583.65 TaxID=1036611 RepID=A0A1L9PAI6_ASPVE|nr:uncharacterized protein ASPVEDRAFT_469802 [Aspergillus versicolor CBS 583.65]OJI98547.1 hypothetical protein ASPVEDRAFT_469802 [Aspergillus versicolor CBS 583.65]